MRRSLSVSKASPVPVECDNHKMASETFSRSVGKKPVFFYLDLIGSLDGDPSGHVDVENSHSYCVLISDEESKMETGHVTRGLRKFPFLLCFFSEEESKMATSHLTRGLRKFPLLLCFLFRKRIQDGDWSGHVDVENSLFYCVFLFQKKKPKWRPVGSRGRRKFPFLQCFYISAEESKMATGHVTGGFRKFSFLLCFFIYFRRRIQDGDGSRDPWI